MVKFWESICAKRNLKNNIGKNAEFVCDEGWVRSGIIIDVVCKHFGIYYKINSVTTYCGWTDIPSTHTDIVRHSKVKVS